MNHGLADLGASAAAVAEHEERDVAEGVEVGAVYDRAAVPLGGDEAGAAQHRQMRRQRVLRDVEITGQVAGGKSFGLVRDEPPERLEAGRLRERCKGEDGIFGFHISRFMEILVSVKLERDTDAGCRGP